MELVTSKNLDQIQHRSIIKMKNVEHIQEKYLLYSKNRLDYFNILANELSERFQISISLDIGCRSGQLVYALRRLRINAFGIDIERNYLARSSNEIKGFLVEADIDLSVLPFSDKCFDLIISHHSVEQIKNIDNFILEIKRVLKPNGIVFLETPTPPLEVPRLLYILRAFKILKSPQDVHPNVHSKYFWRKKFKEYGFGYLGNLNSFIKRTCIELDPQDRWFFRLLLKFEYLGRIAYRFLAVKLLGTLIFKRVKSTSNDKLKNY